MRWVFGLLFLSMIAFAGGGHKPACNKANHGRYWPEAANDSPAVAREMMQRGQLEMCSLAVWRYRWELMSVNVRQISKSKQKRTRESDAAESRLRN